jgi:cytochrome c5
MKKTVLNTSLSTALWTALVVTLGVGVSACSGDKEEILAVDRVEEAADIARQNGPKAEDMGFEATAPIAAADTTASAEVAMATATTDMPAEDAASTDADSAAESEDLAVNVGAELYNKQCMACHQNGLLNAPKYGDAAAWAPRIAKGKETLYLHSAKGFNQMNAQVNADVSEAQVHAAVDYMVAAAS